MKLAPLRCEACGEPITGRPPFLLADSLRIVHGTMACAGDWKLHRRIELGAGPKTLERLLELMLGPHADRTRLVNVVRLVFLRAGVRWAWTGRIK